MGEAQVFLTKEAILKAPDIKTEIVFVEEWKGAVKLVGLTAAQRDAFTQSIAEGKGRDKDFSMVNIRAKFVTKHMMDAEGNPLMTHKELGGKSSAVVERLYDICAKLSGMSEDHLRELAKNSSDGQSDDSLLD